MKKKKKINLSYLLVAFLFISIISISVGFSALSTTLTVNGSASFKPVDMIRVVELKQDSLVKAEEVSSKYTIDGINVLVDINEGGSASYIVKISNLGEVDKEISKIEDEIFSNKNMEYKIEGLEIGDVIKAKETVNLKITFKPKETNNKSYESRLNAKLRFIFEDYVFIPTDYQIVFNANGGDGKMDSITAKYNETTKLPTNKFTNGSAHFVNWNTKKDGSGISYQNEEEVKNINIGNKDKVVLYAIWKESSGNSVNYPGVCTFGGKGVDVTGICSKDSSGGYVNTGIKLFSKENYQKNFILKFTLTDVDDSRFVNAKSDTFMSALYEANNNIGGKYPGVLFRIEKKKLVLHVSNGRQTSTYATDVWFTKDEFINKEFSLIRYNDGETIKLYYILGDSEPKLLRDITDLYTTFDTPLTFGANVAIDNKTPDRYAIGTLKDVSFRFTSQTEAASLLNIEVPDLPDEPDEPDEPEQPEIPEVPSTILDINGSCTFGGASVNVSGEGCGSYNDKFINTGINLFDQDNYLRDFDVFFTIDSYDPNIQEDSQVTLINAFLEVAPKGYGFLVRRSGDKLEFIVRDGKGAEKKVYYAASSVNSVRFVRKNNNICYSINGGTFTFAVNYDKFDGPFNVPLTFGGSIDKNGVPFRFIKGSLSNMHVTLGNIDSNIQCSS